MSCSCPFVGKASPTRFRLVLTAALLGAASLAALAAQEPEDSMPGNRSRPGDWLIFPASSSDASPACKAQQVMFREKCACPRDSGRERLRVPAGLLARNDAPADKKHSPAVYYVDGAGGSGDTGNDSSTGTTTAAAWLTIARAFDTSKPTHVRGGDTLYIRGGTYAERLYRNIPAGLSEAQRTQISNFRSETVVIRPPASSAYHVVAIKPGRDYITIKADAKKHIRIDGSNIKGQCILMEEGADYITLENLEIENAESNGVIGHGTHCLFKNLTVHNNGTDTMHNCAFYFGGSDSTIEGCDVYANACVGINIWDQSTDPQYCNNNKVFNNRVHDNGVGTKTLGEGIAVRRGKNNAVFNNLVWGNTVGITDGFGASATRFYNNTVFNNTRAAAQFNAGIWLDGKSSNAIVRNNLCFGNSNANYRDQSKGATADHNVFGDANPNFASTDPADPNFLKLSAATPTSIRDAGVALGSPYDTDFWGDARPQGSAYDIGADEYLP